MGSVIFSDLELSAIGEIINISLGASATAVSNMLDAKVDITTPSVAVLPTSQFDFSIIDPALCTEISYKEGLDGKNGLLLKMEDVKVIVEMLMHTEIPEEDFELSDLYMSAICEVMNQMMGASATALSEFLGRSVDISTPKAYLISDPEVFKANYFEGDSEIVTVSFRLKIGDRLESEFLNIMRIPLAKELVSAFIPEGFGDESVSESKAEIMEKSKVLLKEDQSDDSGNNVDASDGSSKMMSQEEIEAMLNAANNDGVKSEPTAADNIGAVAVEASNIGQNGMAQMNNMQVPPVMPNTGNLTYDMQMQQMMQQMQQMQQMIQHLQSGQISTLSNTGGQVPFSSNGNGRMVNVRPIPTKISNVGDRNEEQMENKELVMGVPLELSVEIGRTRKPVREILELTKGSLVVLDKLAGEQVDLFVNGQCIAKGDVVVVEDNFGIRVTEIVNRNELGF